MAYTRFQLRCIELGLCIKCGDNAAAKYRRCLKCRQKRNAKERKKRPGPGRPKRKPDALCHPITVRLRKLARERAAGRGYWPEIHGEV
jgi:hypothetical protein